MSPIFWNIFLVSSTLGCFFASSNRLSLGSSFGVILKKLEFSLLGSFTFGVLIELADLGS